MTAPSAPLERLPVLGVCGYRNAGKTTLIEDLLPGLRADGLRVAVLKHDVHGLCVDRPGKDSDRLFRAGASVVVAGPEETFSRGPAATTAGFGQTVAGLARGHDLVLVEGHKRTPLPARIWLERHPGDAPPSDAGAFTLPLGSSTDRAGAVRRFLDAWLPQQGRRVPVRAGVLIGGRSTRMGQAKHLLRMGGRTWLERIVDAAKPCVTEVVLLGSGTVPPSLGDLARLPDVPGHAGPLAGMLSAMRWDPWSSWVFLPCDVPDVSPEAVRWLLDHRAPGRWGVFPAEAVEDRVHPLPAWYDFRMAEALSGVDRPMALAGATLVARPIIPAALAPAWVNINGPLPRMRYRHTEGEGLSAGRERRS